MRQYRQPVLAVGAVALWLGVLPALYMTASFGYCDDPCLNALNEWTRRTQPAVDFLTIFVVAGTVLAVWLTFRPALIFGLALALLSSISLVIGAVAILRGGSDHDPAVVEFGQLALPPVPGGAIALLPGAVLLLVGALMAIFGGREVGTVAAERHGRADEDKS